MNHRYMLNDYISGKYTVPSPIFKLSLDNDSDEILANPLAQCTISGPEDDPLFLLIKGVFGHNFDRNLKVFRVDEYQILDQAYSNLKRHILQFVDSNLETKNPRSTNLYRFFRYDVSNVSPSIIIPLYSYMKRYTPADSMKFTDKTNNRVHFDNIINLLKAIESKYGKK